MFDRIAARLRPHELGHDGRDAPPLARARRRPRPGGAGLAALDVATGTGDLAIELAGRGAAVDRYGLRRRAMLELARAKAPGISFEEGDALALSYGDGEFDAVTVGFGARNFADLDRGLARDGARGAAGRPGGGARDHHAAEAAAFLVLSGLVRPHVPALGRLRATPTPTSTCPAACVAFPVPRSWRARMAGAGLTDVRWILTAGGIIALHSGTRLRREHGPGAAGGGAGGRRPRAHAAARADRVASGRGRRGPRAELGAHADGTLSAGGKRLRPILVFLCGDGERAGARGRRDGRGAAPHGDAGPRRRARPRADLRRGRPTVFASGGRRAATATGDLLFSRAFAELAATGGEDAVRACRPPPLRWPAAS